MTTRRKGKIVPLSLAEVGQDPALSGLVSFLSITPAEARKINSLPEEDAEKEIITSHPGVLESPRYSVTPRDYKSTISIKTPVVTINTDTSKTTQVTETPRVNETTGVYINSQNGPDNSFDTGQVVDNEINSKNSILETPGVTVTSGDTEYRGVTTDLPIIETPINPTQPRYDLPQSEREPAASRHSFNEPATRPIQSDSRHAPDESTIIHTGDTETPGVYKNPVLSKPPDRIDSPWSIPPVPASQVNASEEPVYFTQRPYTHTTTMTPGVIKTTQKNYAGGMLKIRKAVLAQDGHSLAEQALYNILWANGQPENDPNGSRLVRMGYAELSAKGKLARRNVKLNLRRLMEKLSIEILGGHDAESSQAKLYRVFSFVQILERRKNAGLIYYVRDRGGVKFCTQEGRFLTGLIDESETPGVIEHTGVTEESGVTVSAINNESPRHSVQKDHTGGVTETLQSRDSETGRPGVTVTPQNRELLEKKLDKTTTSSELETLSLALSRWGADHQAARQLLASCRQTRPDAQLEEILIFLKEKAEFIRRSAPGRIFNPIGFFLSTIPPQFEGPAFENWRHMRAERKRLEEEERQRREAEQREMDDWLRRQWAKMQAIASDQTAPEKSRQDAEAWIRQMSSFLQTLAYMQRAGRGLGRSGAVLPDAALGQRADQPDAGRLRDAGQCADRRRHHRRNRTNKASNRTTQ